MSLDLELPGFRFHPTEEELLNFYLKSAISGKNFHYNIIGLTNIYHHDPWDLPGLAKIGEREWYFFVPRDKRHGSSNGGKPNRTTENGFWKATGSDRRIVSLSEPKRIIGLKKTLVFYKGRAPRGSKTDWVMNEYRLPDSTSFPKDIVLCKIYRKATSLKVLEQRAVTVEEENKIDFPACSSSPASGVETTGREAMFAASASVLSDHMDMVKELHDENAAFTVIEESSKKEEAEKAGEGRRRGQCSSGSSIQLPPECEKMDLQMPGKLDWTQDTFWNQLASPWFLNNLTPTASILNF